jgi:hypothetical protein
MIRHHHPMLLFIGINIALQTFLFLKKKKKKKKSTTGVTTGAECIKSLEVTVFLNIISLAIACSI